MPRQYVDRASALRSVRKGLENGQADVVGNLPNVLKHGTVVPHHWKMRFSGNCTQPVHRFRDGVALRKGRESRVFGAYPLERPVMTELEVPCRKCDNCLRRRAHHWRLRATAEYNSAPRTWFGTLTLNPEQHYRVLLACRMKAAVDGDDFDKFPPEQQFAARHACISREITLYFKRVRKYSEAEMRYLCVTEKHKTGLPHYHVLVHEVEAAKPLKHAVLREEWRVGFSHYKLVKDPRSAGYVTKYLSKSSEARVRASLDYGNITPSGIEPKVREKERDPEKGTTLPFLTALASGDRNDVSP